MRSRAERHAGFRTLGQITDRHFQFERVVAEPDTDKIRKDVIRMASELRRLDLDTLHGCKVKPSH